MVDPSEDIDEVALNTLLAEGVDLPTALEASRRNSGGQAAKHGCLGAAAIVAAAIGVMILCL